MMISDFNTLFGLLATINIAFVAVDYAKNYTNILAKKVFKLQEVINSKIDELQTIFSDRVSLNTITDLQINNQNANSQIEACKRKQEVLDKKLKDAKEELVGSIDEKCNFRNFSNQCLWLFFFCVAAIFFAGLQTLSPDQFECSLAILSTITLLYLLTGWLFGEKEIKFFNKIFSSLLFVIVVFFISIVISLVVGFFFESLQVVTTKYSNWIIPITALIPFLNFIIYFIVSIARINEIKKDLKNRIDDFTPQCDDWKKSADQLINAHNLGCDLEKVTAPAIVNQ